MKILENFPSRSPLDLCLYIKKYLNNKIVCDLGCGSGDILEFIKTNKLCKDVIGVEFQQARYSRAVKDARNYVIKGNLLAMKIPEAEVYLMWLGKFPYEKIIDQMKTGSIIIYLDGSEENHKQIMKTNCELVESINYQYDEKKYLDEQLFFTDIYYDKLTEQLISPKIKVSWPVIGTRLLKVYQKL